MYTKLFENIAALKGFRSLTDGLAKDVSAYALFSVPDSIKPFFLVQLGRQTQKPIIYICKNAKQAHAAFEATSLDSIALFPPKDMEFARFDAKSREDEHQRVDAMKGLVDQSVSLVFTSFDALMPKLIPSSTFSANLITIETGKDYPIEDLYKSCVSLGYMPESLVEGEGTVARRGSILDIYVPGDTAYRIDFFGDTVESIRHFDPLTQRSLAQTKKRITVSTATEFTADEAAFARAQDKLAKAAQTDASLPDDFLRLEEGKLFEGVEKYLYAFYQGESLLDYAKDAIIVYDQLELTIKEGDTYFSEFKHDLLNLTTAGEATEAQINNLFAPEQILAFAEGHSQIEFASAKKSPSFKSAKEIVLGLKSPAGYMGKLETAADDIGLRIKNGYNPIFYTGSERNARILKNVLTAKELHLPTDCVLPHPLKGGAEFPETKTIIYGETDLFGFQRKTKPTASTDNTLDMFTDLAEGDIVVHELHGKGRYLGLFTMDVQSKKRDYFLLEYRDGDKLYIPTEQIDRVQKYIGGEAPMLSKLGGREWDSAKAKVARSVKALAFDLVKIYSERTQNKGFVFSPDSAWQEDFESSFPFQETDGQLTCIAEIKKDMESPKVMDRLLLGDVGFGKTEVAMRACFKAVYDQKQVAVLVPTTLLSRQHYQNFIERFKGFPVKIAQLSRFVSEKEKKKTLQALAEGNVDILIGTHALLSPRVVFKDLGLLVVDEEQHFGVTHKEKIKDLKRHVDVLTLSATPIPRTMEMSLIGIRDMSMLKTPPFQRKVIKTYVMEYSRSLVARAVSREMQRGGQCYFVCRQINQMDYLQGEIARAVPEARVATVHGQLSEHIIENTMVAFTNGEYDILLSTTIVESGLDIPTCNTLIVHEADKFGLSQLYQLKGRIGRGDVKAVCYLTYLKGDFISDVARKRLDAINQNTEFGAGFKIAMKDLEIRGAGNLLGPEQSGHMASVGYDMYCKLMKKAVSEAKGEVDIERPECSVELGVDAFIPPAYIDDDVVKVESYKKIAAVKNTNDAKAVQDELKDRFGPLPLSVKNLITISLIKSFGEIAGFALITKRDNVFRLKYAETTLVDFEKLMRVLNEYKRSVKLLASEPPALEFIPKAGAVQELFTLLNRIMRCTKSISLV
ncbi:MAG: transcription-repair coupling factor [Eubacteriales bacterium]